MYSFKINYAFQPTESTDANSINRKSVFFTLLQGREQGGPGAEPGLLLPFSRGTFPVTEVQLQVKFPGAKRQCWEAGKTAANRTGKALSQDPLDPLSVRRSGALTSGSPPPRLRRQSAFHAHARSKAWPAASLIALRPFD